MKTIEITVERYNDLLEKEAWLDALEAAGVDSWQGYNEADEYYTEPELVG